MFRIITSRVMEECVQLQQCASLFEAENIEVEAVIRELGTLSGMEEVFLRLNGTNTRMKEESHMIRQMTQALERTIQCYLSCENRISENAEQSAIRHVHREIVMNDFSKISNLI